MTATLMLLLALPQGSDWSQYMRTSTHAGDAADEVLTLPLHLEARVRLEDSILTSPAVVGDSIYVVDQMGTAYHIRRSDAKILWRAAPDGDGACGSNTSSPCVANGRVYYGTTAGSLHILDAATGRTVRTVAMRWPVTAAPVHANDSIYIQSLGAIVHCFDLDGKERWQWDHYARFKEPEVGKPKRGFPGSYDSPHFGGREVAVSGKKIVTGIGWDHLCLEDKGDRADLVWCNRAALGKDDGVPMASSIAGDSVFTGWPGVDAAGSLLRVSLKDGSFDRKKDQLGRRQWAVFSPPAARGRTAFFGRHIRGAAAHSFGEGPKWEAFRWTDRPGFTPTITSPALSKDHCVVTTLTGELLVIPIEAKGSGLDKMEPKPFRYRTPAGRPIGSSPAISRGRVVFGDDAGFLYVLGPEKRQVPEPEPSTTHARRSRVSSATGRAYAWPSPYGNPGNTNFVDDADLKPPFRLRWAVRSFGGFVQPPSATEDDLVIVGLEGTVTCVEQATGRLRWRRRLTPADQLASAAALCAGGRVYVARPASHERGIFYCLSQDTGEILWQRKLGWAYWYARGAPLLSGRVVAFGTRRGKERIPTVEAWDAETGEPRWQVELDGKDWEPHGCLLDGKFIFSGASNPLGKGGETVAMEPKTGKVLWRNREAHTGYRGTPTGRDGRIYLVGWNQPVYCLNVADGSIIWKTERKPHWGHIPALGDGIFTGRGYSGRAEIYRLEDGKRKLINGRSVRIGGPDHACGPVVLTSGGLSLAVTVSGLYVRDVNTGKIIWNSPGFAPRTCSSPAVANGRIFYNPQINGLLYCFEPVLTNQRR